ncbi:anti-sigma regulatory factor (Ser/Thr protein kinase) [Azospirillum agricola]|uniref:ATP-binding protein n=1 Tax=Azospirillum agricola TaxID=1720247 RepID=UPI001F1C9191|nr:ATP-binding protein [Azospirillum agricola]MBP2228203.1 anti-sigma regulatory factor (Ser/Thr protein kinase) [Azospirillum agricola]
MPTRTATAHEPARTRFAALHGLAMAADRLARLSESLALPLREEPAGGGGPVLAVMDGPAAAGDDAFWERPFAAWIEPEEPGAAAPVTTLAAPLPTLVARAGASDLYINLTTATANDLHLAGRVLTALTARRALPDGLRDDLELALHEAISNALVHGNLQVSGMKELSTAELERFSRDLVERLADPALAHRRVEVAVLVEGDAIVVEVADEGPGFVPAPQAGQGASGRGLDLIATIAETMELKDGGRRIRMRFPL